MVGKRESFDVAIVQCREWLLAKFFWKREGISEPSACRRWNLLSHSRRTIVDKALPDFSPRLLGFAIDLNRDQPIGPS